MKAFDNFRAKLLGLAGKKIIILPIYVLIMVVIAFTIYQIFDSLPGILAPTGVNMILLIFFPLFGILIVGLAMRCKKRL